VPNRNTVVNSHFFSLCVLVTLLLTNGCGDSPPPQNRVALFEADRTKFISAIRGATKITVFEGMPHPAWEGEDLKVETKRKDHLILHTQHFYSEPLVISEGEIREIQRAFENRKTFFVMESIVMKMCGGFHADYAVEWTLPEGKYCALICLGCEDLWLRGPGMTHDCMLSKFAAEGFKTLLRPHRQNRPLTKHNAAL